MSSAKKCWGHFFHYSIYFNTYFVTLFERCLENKKINDNILRCHANNTLFQQIQKLEIKKWINHKRKKIHTIFSKTIELHSIFILSNVLMRLYGSKEKVRLNRKKGVSHFCEQKKEKILFLSLTLGKMESSCYINSLKAFCLSKWNLVVTLLKPV